MSARIERTAAPTAPRKPLKKEIIVEFDAERLKAPVLLRCGAILIDYIFIVSVPVVALILGRMWGQDGVKLLNGELSNSSWLIAMLLLVTDTVVFPMFAGQTVGKMLTGLRIVKIDGTPPTVIGLLVRHLIGYPLSALTLGLGFLISFVSPKGRALHDYLAGTVVVYGQRRRK